MTNVTEMENRSTVAEKRVQMGERYEWLRKGNIRDAWCDTSSAS